MDKGLAKSILLSMLMTGDLPSLRTPTLRRIHYEPLEGESLPRDDETKRRKRAIKSKKMRRKKKRGF